MARLVLLATLAALAVFALVSPQPAHANGGPDSRTIFDQPVDGYRLVVTSTPGNPVAGLVHLTFSLTDPAGQSPITDASLTLSVTPPPDSELQPTAFPVMRSEVNPDLYDVNVDLKAEGTWSLGLAIGGDLGSASVVFPLEVRGPGSRIFAILIVVLVFPMLLLLLWVWRRWDRRRKSRQLNQATDVTEIGNSIREPKDTDA